MDRKGRVTLAYMTPEEQADFQVPAIHQWNEGGFDWIHLDSIAVEQTYLSRVFAPLQYYFAHEFGHSLGFGHGGTGIMDQTPDHPFVNAEEIAACQSYWL